MKKILDFSKKKGASRTQSKMSAIYKLIAVVAIIECLILISFTTYSWIETASSLIIETGKKNYDDSYSTRIRIANALNYRFVIKNDSPNHTDVADLNSYFSYSGQSSTQNLYRYARASSANGKDFFFKNSGKNSSGATVTGATSYRAGDMADINSNYTHYDFTVSNPISKKFKFFFYDANVFNVTNGEGSNLTSEQLSAVKDAMRISFQTGSGTPKIYSVTAKASSAVSATDGTISAVNTTAIQASDNQKLFTIGKGTSANPATQNISVRIWLEEKDSGISGLTGEQLAALNITVNLNLTYAGNDYDYLYFDDYTLSSGIQVKGNIGGHLTEDYAESDNKRMYFVYRTSNTDSGYVYPMTIDDSGSNADARSWVTCDSTGTASSTLPDISGKIFIANLTNDTTATGYNSTTAANARKYSYFAYGKCPRASVDTSVTLSSVTDVLYRWNIDDANGASNIASSESELRYSGFSAVKTASSNTYYYGAGGWSYNTPLSCVYFRDLATCSTNNSYNTGDNFKFITTAVNAGSDTGTGNRSDVLYVNTITDTTTSAYSVANAAKTAYMYYDKAADGGNGLYMSWIPDSWLSSSNLNFRYCSNGYYSYAGTAVKWTAGAATKPNNSMIYVYTALGYDSPRLVTDFSSGTPKSGTGCWNAIESEPVYFSTELIDNDVTGAYRYQIGVKINGSNTASYYDLIPDETNTKFYAYVPVPGTNETPTLDYVDGAILFRSYTNHTSSAAVNANWYGKVRNGSRIYYPVKFNTTSATSSVPKGYWNIAVIVDGTYEHFFWDYGDPTTTSDDDVLGTFGYNITGHIGDSVTYNDITLNEIDEYRWYVPFDLSEPGQMPDGVFFRWQPYATTEFKYTLYRYDGIYCVITESPDNTPANAFE